MSPAPLAAGLVGLALLALPTPGQQIETAPVPAWVDPVDVPAPDPAAEGAAELLLLDYQTRLADPAVERHVHVALRVLNEAGVEEQSNVEVDFDPSFEELVFHSVAVHRAGERLDRLAPTAIRMLQREEQLEAHLYSGERTALLILEDVRPGDVIEYAYTLRDASPVFGGRYFGALQMEFAVSVRRLHHRLLVPEGRQLAFRRHGLEHEPPARELETARELGGAIEHVWSLTDVERAAWESDGPAWHDPFAWVQVSEYADWAEVARWGEALFALDGPPDPALLELAERVRAEAETPLERLHGALRLVQAEVRYFGVMLGEGSHRPSEPAEVLARRYGDCKDKARLLVALLAELDVEASPALVSTTHGARVVDDLPSPGSFDHVIVRALIEGDEVWVDPTNDSERGPLDEFALGGPGVALVLAPGTSGLTEVVPGLGTEPATRITKRVRVAPDGSAEIELDTVYEGADANDARAWLAGVDTEALTEQYLDYFCGNEFPEASSLGPVVVQPDEARNILLVKERYAVPDVYDRTGPEPQVTLWPAELHAELVRPSSTRRSTPFALPFPRNVDYQLEVELPYVVALEPGGAQVRNPAFRYESSLVKEGRRLSIRYSFSTLADHVPAGGIARYVADVRRAEEDLGLFVTPPERPVAYSSSPASEAGAAPERGPDDPGQAAAEALGNLVGLLLIVALVAWIARWSSRRARGTGRADPLDAPAIRRHGSVVELDPFGDLPARCVRCNQAATSRTPRKLRWHAPGWYLLVLLGLLPYFVAALVVTQRREITVGLCARHRRLALAGCWGNALAFVGAAALIFVAPLVLPELTLVGLALLPVSLVWALMRGSRALRVLYIDDELTRLTGFGQAFLESLPRHGAPSTLARPAPETVEPGPWSSAAPLPAQPRPRAREHSLDSGLTDWNRTDWRS